MISREREDGLTSNFHKLSEITIPGSASFLGSVRRLHVRLLMFIVRKWSFACISETVHRKAKRSSIWDSTVYHRKSSWYLWEFWPSVNFRVLLSRQICFRLYLGNVPLHYFIISLFQSPMILCTLLAFKIEIYNLFGLVNIMKKTSC